jgi:hypothetical protein
MLSEKILERYTMRNVTNALAVGAVKKENRAFIFASS